MKTGQSLITVTWKKSGKVELFTDLKKFNDFNPQYSIHTLRWNVKRKRKFEDQYMKLEKLIVK